MARLRSLVRAAAILAAAAVFPSLADPVLYAATVRAHTGPADEIAGSLYVVDPSNAEAKAIGPLRIQGKPIGITGLAVHPKSGILYGVTAGYSPNYRNSLVTIDPATAEASFVGEMRVAGSDITFDPAGDLFIWLPDSSQVGRINLASGRVTPIGEIGESTRLEGGIAFDGRGRLYVTPMGATGAIEMRDPVTGTITMGPMLVNAPYLSSLNSLAFSPRGELYGVNSNMGSPAHTALVKVDTHSGVVTQIGALPEDTDCLAFVEAPRAALIASPTSANVVAAGSIAAAGALAVLMWWRERRRRRSAADTARAAGT
jgi:hypothetical protein